MVKTILVLLLFSASLTSATSVRRRPETKTKWTIQMNGYSPQINDDYVAFALPAPTGYIEMPFGQLPVLEVDGKKLSQSSAIERYLSNKFDLAGKDDWERAKVDELTAGVEDLLVKLQPWLNEKSETKKIEIFREIVEKEIGPFLNRYERFSAENKSGFFVGDQLTQADISLFHLFWFFNRLLPGALRKHAHLYNFYTRIAELPRIKEWIDKRPKTEG